MINSNFSLNIIIARTALNKGINCINIVDRFGPIISIPFAKNNMQLTLEKLQHKKELKKTLY